MIQLFCVDFALSESSIKIVNMYVGFCFVLICYIDLSMNANTLNETIISYNNVQRHFVIVALKCCTMGRIFFLPH